MTPASTPPGAHEKESNGMGSAERSGLRTSFRAVSTKAPHRRLLRPKAQPLSTSPDTSTCSSCCVFIMPQTTAGAETDFRGRLRQKRRRGPHALAANQFTIGAPGG